MPGEVKVMVPTLTAEEHGIRNVIDKASDKETVKIKITKVKEVVEPMRMEEQNEKE